MPSRTRRRKHVEPPNTNTILSNLTKPNLPLNFSEEYIRKNITIRNGKIVEDVYTQTNRNGKKQERGTHRVIPLAQRNTQFHNELASHHPTEDLTRFITAPIHIDTMSPLLQICNRMPSPFLAVRYNAQPIRKTQTKKRRSTKRANQTS